MDKIKDTEKELNELKKENEYLKLVYKKDIDNYKTTEDVLRKSEEKYRQFVETSIEGILSIDSNRCITLANQQMATMLGYTIEEMLGKKYESFLPEDQLEDDIIQAKIRAQGKNAVYERCFLRKDGKRHWTIVSAKTILDSEGKIVGSFGMVTDINDRKLTEAALQESERKYRQIVETSIEGILSIDSNRCITLVNQQMATMLGYAIEEMLGKKYESFLPEDQLEDDSIQAKIRAQGKNAVYERCFLRKDGQRHWTIVSAKTILDSKGKIVGSFGMVTDINDRKLAEAALQDSEEKYRRIVETANEGILSFDHDTKLNFVNQQMAAMLGYTIEEMLDQNIESFLAEDQLGEHYVRMKNCRLGENAIYERCFKRKDGKRYWMLVSAKAIMESDGNYAGSFAMCMDINDRKRVEAALHESELQYRLLFETAREGIAVIQKGKLSYFNPMMSDITGYSYEELLNMNFFEFVYHEDRDLILSNLNNTITGGDTELRYQFRMIKKDYSLCWVEMGSLKFTWKGETATLNFIIDITENKLAEIELAKLNEELRVSKDMIEENLFQKNILVEKLKNLNSEKDKFFSIIAHDLSSPFQGFIGLTEIMVEDIDILSKSELSEMSND
ncbi:MAG: PAS domain S-box protein, partial [Ignavibacteriaceae bacterium]|nr:PAS domain S-box protein [Ignavibacteriaceae bacterium]